MEHFRHWLGRHNGEEMLCAIFQDCTSREARCAIVTYCKIFDVKPDSEEWEKLIGWIDECYNSWFKDKEELNEYLRLEFER